MRAFFSILFVFCCCELLVFAAEKKPCVFCEIVRGKSPASIVYRDSKVMAFMDIAPKNPGHVLVVPVEHFENIYDLPSNIAGEMIASAQKIVLAIKKTDIKAEAIQLRMNNGPLIQGIKHAHLHVIPRFQDDGGDRSETWTPKAPREELDAVAQKIRTALEVSEPAPSAKK